MSQEPEDDISPRRRPAGADDAESAEPADPAKRADPKHADTAERADASEPHGEERARPTIGPPVDPYADPLHGAGPYEQPEPPSAPEAGEDGVVAGEVYQATQPPQTEMRRLQQYRREQDAESPPKPPPQVVGRYPHESHLPTHPTDTVRQFSSMGGGKPRRRRSDWPVLTFALVVAAVVTLGCCLAGFALFSAWNPFNG